VCSVSWCPDPTGGPAQQNLASAADDGSVRIWRFVKLSEYKLSLNDI